MIKARRTGPDWILLCSALLLAGLGTAMIYSASSGYDVLRGRKAGPMDTLEGHLAHLVTGIVAMLAAFLIPPRVWGRLSRPLCYAGLGSLVLVFVHGVSRNGARRWFSVAGTTVQPSEFAKLSLVVFLAWVLSRRVGRLGEWRELLLPVGISAAMGGLILVQPNFSMAAMFGAIALVMLVAAGIPWIRLVQMALVVAPLGWVAFLAKGYRADRLSSFLEGSTSGKGFQAWQSLVALGNGGLFGEGLGRGTAKLLHLPEPYTDTIFAVIGEELGLLGTLTVLGLFALFAWRGFRIAMLSHDRFHALLATGLTSALVLNAALHTMVCTRLMPTTGQPMPFVSYGGTSLLLSMGALGVLLNLSRRLDECHDELAPAPAAPAFEPTRPRTAARGGAAWA